MFCLGVDGAVLQFLRGALDFLCFSSLSLEIVVMRRVRCEGKKGRGTGVDEG